MYLAVSSHHSGRSLRPISGSSLHTCKPFENKLCYIARFNSHGSYGPQCALKMYTGATVDELNSHCAFRCHESQAMIISEVQDDVYVITHPQPMMLIQCGHHHECCWETSALQVHLPCNCQLRLKEDVVIPTRYPCGGNTTSHRPNARFTSHLVKPEIFAPKTLLHDTHPTFDNFARVPRYQLDTPSPPCESFDEHTRRRYLPHRPNQSSESLGLLYSIQEAHSDASVLIWNIVLSLAVLYL
ncbi:unnamed protein product, partial [Tenebrio molitor]